MVEEILNRFSSWLIVALTLTAIGLAVPAVRHLREQPPPPPPTLSLTLGAPPDAELGSGDDPLDAAISPDERRLIFVATSAGTTSLWSRSLDSDRAEILRGTEGAQLPTWSPAGDAIAFFSGGRLRTISLADGAVADLADAPSPSGVAWLPDGSMLFAPRPDSVIHRLRDGEISDATVKRPGDRGHVFPGAAGTADDFVYTAIGENGRRTVRLVRGDEERDLTTTSGHGQIVGDRVLYVRDNVLLAQAIDSRGSRQPSGTPIATGVGVSSNGRALFSASARMLLTAGASPRGRELAWFDMDGQRIGTTGDAGDFWQVRLSPDDGYAAVTLVAPLLRTLDVALVPIARGSAVEPLTLALAADSDPVWAPDGRRVLFRSLQRGRPALFTKRTHDEAAQDEPLTDVDMDLTPTDWRGSTVLAHGQDPSSGYDVWAIDAQRGTRTPAVKSGFSDTDGRWSPDGAWLAYVSDESGQPDIYVRPWPNGERIRVSFAGGTRPRWSRDGRSVFFLRGSTIMRAVRDESGSALFASAVAVLDVPGVRDFDLARQRDALLVLVPVQASSPAPVSVLIDWQSPLLVAR